MQTLRDGEKNDEEIKEKKKEQEGLMILPSFCIERSAIRSAAEHSLASSGIVFTTHSLPRMIVWMTAPFFCVSVITLCKEIKYIVNNIFFIMGLTAGQVREYRTKTRNGCALVDVVLYVSRVTWFRCSLI